MTISVQLETRIARPVPDVFGALIDIESYPTWLVASGITRVELLDTAPLHAGSRLRIGQTVAGRSTVLDGIVTVLGLLFLYYGLKAVQLTEMANRVWKRTAEYNLILSERQRLAQRK